MTNTKLSRLRLVSMKTISRKMDFLRNCDAQWTANFLLSCLIPFSPFLLKSQLKKQFVASKKIYWEKSIKEVLKKF